jgi:hypothetical protein
MVYVNSCFIIIRQNSFLLIRLASCHGEVYSIQVPTLCYKKGLKIQKGSGA